MHNIEGDFDAIINRDLLLAQQEIKEIQQLLVSDDCCILSSFEKLQAYIVSAQSVAASYYLQMYLAPFTSHYTEISIAAYSLAEKRHGGLFVIEREVELNEYIHQSIPIDAEISTSLIQSIFYPGNPLHDGGIVIRKEKIHAAAAVLPISTSEMSVKLGTRHRAALGISECSDALAIVISEETGRVSFALNGKLHVIKV